MVRDGKVVGIVETQVCSNASTFTILTRKQGNIKPVIIPAVRHKSSNK